MKITTKDFIVKAKSIHGDKYDYSKTEYIKGHDKVCIICPKHGEFWQTPCNHTHKTKSQGCPMCKKEKLSQHHFLSQDEVLERFKNIHKDKYDYSEVVFKGMNQKISIKCNKCGHVFNQVANSHYHGNGCPKCTNRLIDTNQFIEDAKKVHGDKYDYSKVEYKKACSKVCIICPKHGEFWQNRDKHVKRKHGCPHCKESKLEQIIRTFLERENLKFEAQKRFLWLGTQSLDFYLPQFNIAIECQGIQHFIPVDFGFKDSEKVKIEFKKIQEKDYRKKLKCQNNGIQLIYFTDNKYNFFLNEKCIHSIDELSQLLKSKIESDNIIKE